MVDTLYIIVCGMGQHLQLGEVTDERTATDLALEHDRIHRCSPWVQYPLEHVHRDDA